MLRKAAIYYGTLGSNLGHRFDVVANQDPVSAMPA
jgi:hypothetical protein